MKSQSLSKLLKLYKEGAHRTLSGKLFQQFTRRHENENARALFAHCGLNTLSLPLVWLLIVKLKLRKLSSMATMEWDILYIIVRSNFNLLSSSDSAQRVLSLMNSWLNFGGDPDHRLDTEIVFQIRYHYEIGKGGLRCNYDVITSLILGGGMHCPSASSLITVT